MLNQRRNGFTLVELVIGIVVLAVALTLVTGVLGPLYQRSGDLWQQVRAAELAQSLLSEIQARSFDEQSSRTGSPLRCDETGAPTCAAVIPACPVSGMTALTEEANRADWDDVDDYHCFRADAASLTDLLGNTLANRYAGFQIEVTLSFQGNALGFSSDQRVKRILLTVTDPGGVSTQFSAIKGNW